MAYFPDLSPYTYTTDAADTRTDQPMVNVGWLAGDQPFATGEAPEGLLDALVRLARRPRNRMRGIHLCDICERPGADEFRARYLDFMSFQHGATQVTVGNGEIRVAGAHVWYAAPTLILHYVAVHRYVPPAEFVTSVFGG